VDIEVFSKPPDRYIDIPMLYNVIGKKQTCIVL